MVAYVDIAAAEAAGGTYTNLRQELAAGKAPAHRKEKNKKAQGKKNKLQGMCFALQFDTVDLLSHRATASDALHGTIWHRHRFL